MDIFYMPFLHRSLVCATGYPLDNHIITKYRNGPRFDKNYLCFSILMSRYNNIRNIVFRVIV